ncbi:MAG: alpha/beta hydrolase [Pseudomonadota bacterium]
MLEVNGEQSLFKNEQQRAEYLLAYDRSMAELWPQAFDTLNVATRFGSTHVTITGPKDGEPVVLLHGHAPSSTMWYSTVAGLVEAGYRTYCPDRPGDAGKSTFKTELRNRQELADWLLDTLDALKLDKPAMIGLSYGGFMNMNFATIHPDRIGKIVCLAPGYVLRKIRFWFHVRTASSLLPGFRPLVTNFLKWLSGGIDHGNNACVEQLRLAWRFASSPAYMPPVFSDAELASISQPTLVVIGDHEVIYDSRAALERAEAHIPNVETELLEGAGHNQTLDQPERLNDRILRFLDGKSEG